MAQKRSKERTQTIRGILVLRETRRPGTGYTVALYDAREGDVSEPLARAKTDRLGRFSLSCTVPESVDLVVTDRQGHVAGDAGPILGKDRFRTITIQVAEGAAQELNRELATELEKLLKKPKNLRHIAEILHEESGVDKRVIYDQLVESDPFGISPFTFRTTICCILYDLLDTFKQTGLGSSLGMGGNTYKHLGYQTVRGFVAGPVNAGANIWDGVEGRIEIDEDFNFDIQPTIPSLFTLARDVRQSGRIPAAEADDMFSSSVLDPTSDFFQRLHCEIIPCDQTGVLRRFMSDLQSRADDAKRRSALGQPVSPIWVEVAGPLTFDGDHLGFRAHLEIHPVKHAVFI
jgi:hypothetical protein